MRRISRVLIALIVLLSAADYSHGADSVSPRPASVEPTYATVRTKRKPSDKAWVARPTRTLESLAAFSPTRSQIQLSRYGGRADVKAAATGFFYVRRTDDRWWLIDPDGHPFMHIAVCSVNKGRSAISQEPAVRKFGTWDKWAEFCMGLLHDNGFNGTGGWTDTADLRKTDRPPVYTLSWSFMGGFGSLKRLTHQQPGHLGYPNSCIPVFHPEFEQFCDEYARQLAATHDDPWLLGHFSDNELPIVSDMLDRSLTLDPNNPDLKYGYEAARDWLSQRKGPASTARGITDQDRVAFLEYALDRYFRITTAAIHRYDPNHLCLGPRLHGGSLSKPYVFSVAGKYLDVIAINYYGAWGPDPERMSMWTRQSGRPFMITEFYAKGHDSGLANNTGAGWLVPTQKDRGRFYQHFTLGLLESKACVGWHWFKFRDNNPLDTSTDPSNRDSNKGIVDYQYIPYEPLLNDMKRLNTRIYELADHLDAR